MAAYDILKDNDSDIDYDDCTSQPTVASRNIENEVDVHALKVEQEEIFRVEEEVDDKFIREAADTETDFDFAWTSDRTTFTSKRERYTGSPGPTFPVTEDMTPVDSFNHMFDDDIFGILVTETNRYADQTVTKLKTDPATRQHTLTWTPTDRGEMVAFLALMMLQGLYLKVNEEAYLILNSS